MITKLYFLFAISMAVAVISTTVTKASVFKGLRSFVNAYCSPFFGELVACPFCFSFYVAAFISLPLGFDLLKGIVFADWTFIGIFLSYFCVIGISSILTGIILRLNS